MVPNNLERRIYEHKSKLVVGFTKRYNMGRLVYFAQTADVLSAISREKQIKGWLREKEIRLIEAANPTWEYLSASF